MKTTCLQLYRFTILCSHIVSFVVTAGLDVTKVNDQRAYDLKLFSKRFFTGWNAMFQMAFLVVALANTIMQSKSFTYISPVKKRILNKVQGYIFTSLVVPSTLFVAFMFWSLWTYNRELVLSKVLDSIVPSWLNHCMHTVILVPVIVELLFSKMQLPHHKHALAVLAVLHIVYTGVLISTYLEYGRWIYHLFSVLGWPERFLMNFVCFLLSVVGYYIGYKLQELRWRKTIVSQINSHIKTFKSIINF